MTMTDSDFERHLANAMHRLAPADDEDAEEDAPDRDEAARHEPVVPLRPTRRRRALALAGSASAVAAAAAAVLVVTLGNGGPGEPRPGSTGTPTAGTCRQLEPTAGTLRLAADGRSATSLVRLRNTTGRPCVLRAAPSVRIVLGGVASLPVPPAGSASALPARLSPDSTATLRIEYTRIKVPATQGRWRIVVRLPGGAATSTPMIFPRDGVEPQLVTVVRAG